MSDLDDVLDVKPFDKIMIVDDAPFNIMSIKMMLERQFKLDKSVFDHCATNGLEAVKLVMDDIQKYGKCCYTLILMDCQMPIMDGYEATKEIKKVTTEDDTPRIVAVTGHAEQKYVDICYDSGMDDVIPKPLTHTRLSQELHKCQFIDQAMFDKINK